MYGLFIFIYIIKLIVIWMFASITKYLCYKPNYKINAIIRKGLNTNTSYPENNINCCLFNY